MRWGIWQLESENWQTRRQAIEKLGGAGKITPLRWVMLNDEDLTVGRAVLEALIAALKNKDYRVRCEAAEVLGKSGDVQAVEPLVAALEDNDSRVRQAAAGALGKIGSVRPLVEMLRHTDWRIQDIAAKALVKLRTKAISPLVAVLNDEDYRVRCKAAKVLGESGDVQVVEPLITALEDNDSRVRQAAAEALGKIGKAQAVESLIAMLDLTQATPAIMGGVGQTSIPTIVFQAWVYLDGNDYPCRLQADFSGNERIIGRDVLNRMDVRFRGPNGEVVINP